MSEHPIGQFMNWASAISVIGTLIGWLPNLAAGAGLIWYLVLLNEHFAKKRKPR